MAEVERLYSEHPRSEHDTVLRMDRLLGQLMPLRAFGDFRFKWPRHVLEKWVSPIVGESALPPHYKTPPYLTASPEIVRYTLGPRDKFLVIASDGLWDLLSPTQVVRLVIAVCLHFCMLLQNGFQRCNVNHASRWVNTWGVV